MSLYLIHSAKGTTWANHKYKKIVNGKYIYDDKAGNVDTAEKEEIEDEKSEDTSSNKSKKSEASIRKEEISKLANGVMSGKVSQNQLRKTGNYIDAMNAVNSKFKKPSSSGSSKKKDENSKTEKEKSEKKTSTKEEKTTSQSTTKSNQVVQKTDTVVETPKTEETKTETNTNESAATDNSVSSNIKSAVQSVVNVTDDDHIYATKNEDGTTTVTVDFKDGTTQNFILTQTFDVISKTEKSKKQLSHSTFKGKGYLIHRMM